MNWFISVTFKLALLVLPVMIIFSSCNKLSPAEKQAQFMASLNAAGEDGGGETLPPQDQMGTMTTELGTPADLRSEQKAVCGNGIIEGEEYCDRDNITHRKCTDFGGGVSGEIGCTPDCILDISRCITIAVDEKIGGLAEVCKCTCNNNNCQGGCAPIFDNDAGNVDCLFRCDNDCTCRCEGKTETHIEYCNITCQCNLGTDNIPFCNCFLDECELLTVIVPNIAELAGRKARFPVAR